MSFGNSRLRGAALATFAVTLLATGPLAGLAPRAAAQTLGGKKPIAIVSIASINEILGDVNYVMTAADMKDLAPMVPGLAGQFTAGIDRTRPIGFVATMGVNEEKPEVLGFVPVTNLDQFLGLFEQQIGTGTDVGGGVKRFDAADEPVFVKQVGGWAFIANKQDLLADLPADPTPWLQGLDKEYEIAFRWLVQNVPAEYRKMAIQGLQQGVNEALAEMDDDPDLENVDVDALKKLIRNQVAGIEQKINETQDVTLGLAINSQTKSIYVDLGATAVPGTGSARQMNALKDTTTRFAGILDPDAAVAAHMAMTLSDDDVSEMKTLMQSVRVNALRELEKDEDIPAEKMGAAKSIVGKLFDVIDATLDTGKVDGGFAMLMGAKEFRVASVGQIADGAALEQLMKEMAEMLEGEPDFPGVKWSIASEGAVTFHAMQAPVEEEDEKNIFGDTVTIVFGIGPDVAMMAVAADADSGVATLKKITADSAAATGQTVPPLQVSIALSPMIKFAASVDDDPELQAALPLFEGIEGNDHISLTMKPVNNGFVLRLEVEDGLLQVAGKAVKAAMSAGGPGAGPPLGEFDDGF